MKKSSTVSFVGIFLIISAVVGIVFVYDGLPENSKPSEKYKPTGKYVPAAETVAWEYACADWQKRIYDRVEKKHIYVDGVILAADVDRLLREKKILAKKPQNPLTHPACVLNVDPELLLLGKEFGLYRDYLEKKKFFLSRDQTRARQLAEILKSPNDPKAKALYRDFTKACMERRGGNLTFPVAQLLLPRLLWNDNALCKTNIDAFVSLKHFKQKLPYFVIAYRLLGCDEEAKALLVEAQASKEKNRIRAQWALTLYRDAEMARNILNEKDTKNPLSTFSLAIKWMELFDDEEKAIALVEKANEGVAGKSGIFVEMVKLLTASFWETMGDRTQARTCLNALKKDAKSMWPMIAWMEFVVYNDPDEAKACLEKSSGKGMFGPGPTVWISLFQDKDKARELLKAQQAQAKTKHEWTNCANAWIRVLSDHTSAVVCAMNTLPEKPTTRDCLRAASRFKRDSEEVELAFLNKAIAHAATTRDLRRIASELGEKPRPELDNAWKKRLDSFTPVNASFILFYARKYPSSPKAKAMLDGQLAKIETVRELCTWAKEIAPFSKPAAETVLLKARKQCKTVDDILMVCWAYKQSLKDDTKSLAVLESATPLVKHWYDASKITQGIASIAPKSPAVRVWLLRTEDWAKKSDKANKINAINAVFKLWGKYLPADPERRKFMEYVESYAINGKSGRLSSRLEGVQRRWMEEFKDVARAKKVCRMRFDAFLDGKHGYRLQNMVRIAQEAKIMFKENALLKEFDDKLTQQVKSGKMSASGNLIRMAEFCITVMEDKSRGHEYLKLAEKRVGGGTGRFKDPFFQQQLYDVARAWTKLDPSAPEGAECLARAQMHMQIAERLIWIADLWAKTYHNSDRVRETLQKADARIEAHKRANYSENSIRSTQLAIATRYATLLNESDEAKKRIEAVQKWADGLKDAKEKYKWTCKCVSAWIDIGEIERAKAMFPKAKELAKKSGTRESSHKTYYGYDWDKKIKARQKK